MDALACGGCLLLPVRPTAVIVVDADAEKSKDEVIYAGIILFYSGQGCTLSSIITGTCRGTLGRP